MMDVEKQAELKLYKKILIRLYCYKVKYQKWCSGKSHKKRWQYIISGEYQKYYEKMYGNR